MPDTVLSEIRRLGQMSVGELHGRYVEVFGEPARSRNRDYLRKRIAWRIQELAEGGLPERVKARALALARDADLRVVPPRAPRGVPVPPKLPAIASEPRDPRTPSAGATFRREFRGATHEVTVLEDGFEYKGRRYKSLSAVAREITGTRWNGWAFFGIAPREKG
ncbi:MAG: DUF2924 domain-containing protein [Kofleriaceae bacterium]|nr:DUF2924 domain-containing protein [Kofleriaceae bacterium]